MARMGIGYGMTPDGGEAVIQINKEDKPLGHITLDASALDGVIRDLAKIRRNMSEPVTPELDPSARIETESGFFWRVFEEHDAAAPGVLMALRHEGLGWLGFLFDRESALQLAAALVKYAPSDGDNAA